MCRGDRTFKKFRLTPGSLHHAHTQRFIFVHSQLNSQHLGRGFTQSPKQVVPTALSFTRTERAAQTRTNSLTPWRFRRFKQQALTRLTFAVKAGTNLRKPMHHTWTWSLPYVTTPLARCAPIGQANPLRTHSPFRIFIFSLVAFMRPHDAGVRLVGCKYGDRRHDRSL